MHITGQITGYDGEYLTIRAPFTASDVLMDKEIKTCSVILEDGRSISTKQRRSIFALINNLTEYISAPVGAQQKRERAEILRHMQLAFLIDTADCEAVRQQLTLHYCDLLDINLFSLSDVDMTTAREFINWLVELHIIHGLPCNSLLMHFLEPQDVAEYLYSCLANKRCCLCQRKAEVHHCDRVQMGRNRKEIVHEGMNCMALCRLCHTACHNEGQRSFNDRWKVFGVKLDDKLCDIWKLRSK